MSGCALLKDAMGRFVGINRTIGHLDNHTIHLAQEKGINITGGSLRKQDGRVILFAPYFPGIGKHGYCMRSRIVWWLHTGEALTGCEWNLHHRNHNRADDRIENLEKIHNLQHAKLHRPEVANISRNCKNCGALFCIKQWRLNKDRTRGQFCSQTCYYSFPKSAETRAATGEKSKKWWSENKPPKYHHTLEAKEKISLASKAYWQSRRAHG